MARRSGLLVLLLLVSTVVAGCFEDASARKQKYLDRGTRYFEAKKYSEAIIEFRNALQVDPRSVPALVMLGRSYAARSWYLEAVQEFERALDLRPNDPVTIAALARLNVRLGAWDDATRYGELLRLIDRDNPWAAYAIGSALRGQGQDQTGADMLARAARAETSEAEIHTAYGDALAAVGRSAEAETAYRKALQLDPKSGEAMVGLGVLLAQHDDLDAGRKLLLQAREVDPDNARVRLASSAVLAFDGRPADAIRELEEVPPRARSVAVVLALANLYVHAERHEDAARLLGPIVSRFPKVLDLQFLHGHALLGIGKVDQAVEAFRQAQRVDPRQPLVGYNLALAYQRAGRHAEAVKELESLVKRTPRSADYHLALSWSLLALGRVDEATRAAETARQLAPERHGAYSVLGAIAASRRDFGHARDLYARAIAADPGSAHGYLALGHLLTLEQKPEDALRQYEAALQHNPRHFPSIVAKIQTLVRLNRAPEALRFAEEQSAADPSNVRLLTLLGNLYAAKPDLGRARDVYARAIKLDPTSLPIHLALAKVALAERKDADAENHLAIVLKEQPGNEEAVIAVASIHSRQGRYDQAAAVLGTALKANPDSTALALALAESHLRAGRNDDALAAVQPVLTKQPRSIPARVVAGLAQAGKGNHAEAIKHFEAANQVDPKIASNHHHLGRARAAVGDVEGARRAFTEALRLNPGAKQVEIDLALLSDRTPDPAVLAGRIDELKAAVDRDPGHVVNRYRLAVAYAAANRHAEAEAEYKKVLTALPGFAPANRALGVRKFSEGQLDEAAEYMRAVLRVMPNDVRAHEVLADYYYRRGNKALSLPHIEAIYRVDPGRPGLGLELAQAYLRAGRVEEALVRTREAVAANPKSPAPLRVLGDLHLKRRAADEAVDAFSRAVALAPNDPSNHLGLGNAYELKGDLERAVAAYRKAATLDERNPVPFNNLAWVYATSGDNLKEALFLAQRARALAPNSSQVLDTLGFVYFKRGEFHRAVPLFRQASESLREDAGVHYRLGMSLYRLGRNDEAVRALRRSLQLDEHQADAAEMRRIVREFGR